MDKIDFFIPKLRNIKILESDRDLFYGKRALLRVDYNLPADEDGNITDFSRFDLSISMINYLEENGLIPIICSHYLRPDLNDVDLAKYSFEKFLPQFEKRLNKEIIFIKDINETINFELGKIYLYENLRLFKGEKENDYDFAKKLAKDKDIYINNAFSVAHRECASNHAICKILPSFAGINLCQEIDILSKILSQPKRPLTVIVGGAKISSKIDSLRSLVKIADNMIIVGAMANNFLYENGYSLGKSLIEYDQIGKANEIMNLAKKFDCNIILPVDGVFAFQLKENEKTFIMNIQDKIDENLMMLDIGPKTIEIVKDIIKSSNSILCNGPYGAFEFAPFDKASIECFNFIATETQKHNKLSVCGGGDSLACIKKAGAIGFTHLSNAGGAFLEFLEGKKFKSLELLESKR